MPSLGVGSCIGERYTLLCEIGRGGMGVVYQARDDQVAREVAIKILLGDSDPEGVRRLQREARAMASLGSTGVAQFYEVGVAETGEIYLVMELVRGENVRATLRRRGLDHAEALRVVREVASTLGRAHREGLVHRDVKPDNVMLCEDGRVVLLDFGIVKSVQASEDTANLSTQLTTAGAVVGTPAYLSPEQALGRTVGPETDQFSLAVMAFQLLAGELPWTAKEFTTIIGQILGETPAAPSSLNAKLSPAVDAVFTRALSKAPADRFPTIDAFADALERAARGEYVDAAITPNVATTQTGEITQRAAGRSGTGGRVVAIVVALAAATGAGLYMRAARHRSAEPAAAAPTPGKPGPLDLPPTSTISGATDAYRRGIEALRDELREAAERELDSAVKIDPGFAAAHLRRAMTKSPMKSGEREHLREAVRLRASLGTHDRILLDALAPLVSEPEDVVTAEARLARAVGDAPSDPDFALQLCRMQKNLGEYAKAKETCVHASTLDPDAATPFLVRGVVSAHLEDVPAALASFDACLKVSPLATSCLQLLMQLQAFDGKCSEALASGRRLLADDPAVAQNHGNLASLLAGADQPIESVRLALDDQLARTDAADVPVTRFLTGSVLAVLTGNFAGADRLLREWNQTVAKSGDEADHIDVTQMRIRLAEEEGENATASSLAAGYLAQRPAWTPAPYDDISIYFDGELYRTGAISREEFAARRGKWIAWKQTQPKGNAWGSSLGFAWIAAYAAPAVTAGDAQEALDALHDYLPLPDPLARAPDFEEPIGRVYLLAKREREALPFLRNAAKCCLPFMAPFEVVEANLELGLALESTGDVPAACDAYRAVTRRWGGASSRSARSAKARVLALHCPP